MQVKLRRVGPVIILTTIGLLVGALSAVAMAIPDRPKIGLALGGGSAKGFVHIGVLQWLEENHIPVDYIAGTSMGGLIGGVYAIGMSPVQIEQFVKKINWDQLFDSAPPFNTLSFRRKEVLLNYLSNVEFGLKDKLLVSNGLSGYRVDLLLSRLALPYSRIRNFYELPVPFSCVATDLRNSEKVVLSDGSLSEALRATMSLPGIFAPVEKDGRLLVDGGLVDNVPADVAQQMGADIVIAVNCSSTNTGKDMRRLNSILTGSLNTMMIVNTNNALRMADIEIHPQVEPLTGLDWKAVDQFITIGYQAAAAQAATLRKWALNDRDWREYLQKRAAVKHSQSLIPEAVAVTGTDSEQAKNIEQQLRVFKGHPINPDQLEASLIEILGSGLYQSFRYELILQDEIPTLLITVKEKDYGPPYIRLVSQTNLIGDSVAINLLSRLSIDNIVGENSELTADLSLGTDPGIIAELYRPITPNGLFIAPRVTWRRNRDSFYQDRDHETDFKKINQCLGLDLGYSINKFSELRFGYERGRQEVDRILGSALAEMDGSYGKLALKWSYINFTNALIPQGLRGDFKVNRYDEAPGSNDRFDTVETSLKWLKPVNSKNIFAALFGAGATTAGNPPLLQQFALGGPLRLGTYNLNELRGDNYLLGSIGFIHSLGKPLGINQLYLGVLVENGGVFDSWSDMDCNSDLTIGLISSTFLGPIYLGTSFGEADKGRISLLLGKLF
jgi:NTE family protein